MMQTNIDYISAIVFSSDYNIWMTQPLQEINARLDHRVYTYTFQKNFASRKLLQTYDPTTSTLSFKKLYQRC
jgi:hypothetical protein